MRRQRAKLCIGLVIGGALALAGCSSAASSSAPTTLARGEGALAQGLGQKAARSSAKGAPTAGAPAASATVGETAVTLAPLIVRTGDVTLGVRRPNVVKTFDRVASIALALGGFVQSSTTGVSPTVTPPQPQPVESSTASSSAMATGASLVVRVPTNQFAALGKQVAALGHVRSETLTGKDVTGQSINLQARITNLESEQDALRALMARTGSIPDILQVQNELFSVEGQIEQLTGDELAPRQGHLRHLVGRDPAVPQPLQAGVESAPGRGDARFQSRWPQPGRRAAGFRARDRLGVPDPAARVSRRRGLVAQATARAAPCPHDDSNPGELTQRFGSRRISLVKRRISAALAARTLGSSRASKRACSRWSRR